MTPPPDPPGTDEDGGNDRRDFLSRWSARKRAEAVTAGASPPPGQTPQAVAAAADGPDAGCGAQEVGPDVLAALPRIEDIGPGSDIRAFLQAGIPRALRNAALRRAWTTDPVISTYEDPARDYFWDFNSPALAGHGGPLPVEAVRRMAENLASGAPAPATAEANPAPAEGSGQPVPLLSPDAAAAVPAAADPAPVVAPSGTAETAAAATGAPVRRRHGGAMPV